MNDEIASHARSGGVAMLCLTMAPTGAGVAGGAVYDGMVALAAIEHGARLLTCDRRALTTYATLGASVELLAGD